MSPTPMVWCTFMTVFCAVFLMPKVGAAEGLKFHIDNLHGFLAVYLGIGETAFGCNETPSGYSIGDDPLPHLCFLLLLPPLACKSEHPDAFCRLSGHRSDHRRPCHGPGGR